MKNVLNLFLYFQRLSKMFFGDKCSGYTSYDRSDKIKFSETTIVSIAIQSAAQSWRAQLSTTNIVLAEVFTADNWENRQVDAFSDYVR